MFNPNEHLMQFKRGQGTSDYLEVKWRLVWFREQCPQGTIDTEEIIVDLDREVSAEVSVWNPEKRRSEKVMKTAQGYARFRAVVTDGKGGRATATKSESAVDFADFMEKAETGSVGRALAMLGFGTQFTGDELAEHHRIVDSPVPSPAVENAPTTQPEARSTSQQKQLTDKVSARENGSTSNQPDARAQLNALFTKGREKQLFANTVEMAAFAGEVLERAVTRDELAKLSQDELIRLDYAIAGTAGLNGAA